MLKQQLAATGLRKLQVIALRAFYKESQRRFKEWKESGFKYPPPASLLFPEICRGMKCEAKTRNGFPCKNDGTCYSNGRCKFHGGASTGPTTEAGKIKSANNWRSNKAFTANPMQG
jgi:hypothetical protein